MMKDGKLVIIGTAGSNYVSKMAEALKGDLGVVFINYEGDMDLEGIHVDYFLLDEAPQLDRNLEKLQNMELEPSVMVPDMFEYVKESPSLRNQNRGYWQKGRW